MEKKEKKIKELDAELKKVYLFIADIYKRMSKRTDNVSLRILQSSVDREVAEASGIREKLEAARLDYLRTWDDIRNNRSNPSDPEKDH